MSAPALLSELRRRDIQLRADGNELRLSAPAGALTAELREQLREHKADLLALLASVQALATQQRSIVPLQQNGARIPIYGVPGHNGDVFCYRALAQRLGVAQPFYGLQPPGLDGSAAPLARMEALAAHLDAEIRAFHRGGPCIIAGFCAGGAVAFELARRLQAAGTPVALLALFGSPFPIYFRRRVRRWLHERADGLVRHVRAFAAAPSWRERRHFVVAQLAERRARVDRRRAAALDPVLVRRAAVEQATLQAVCAYRPQRFEGPIALFLAGIEWQRAGVAALHWRRLAARSDVYQGPEASTGYDMLREPHVAAFAEMMRRRCEEIR